MTVLILVLVVVSILLYVSAMYDSVILSSVQVLNMMAIQTTANTNSCLVSILCNMQQLGNISSSLRVHLGLGRGLPPIQSTRCLIFISRPFQPKAGLPRGGGVKKALYLQCNRWDLNLGHFSPHWNALTAWPQHHSLARGYKGGLSNPGYEETPRTDLLHLVTTFTVCYRLKPC